MRQSILICILFFSTIQAYCQDSLKNNLKVTLFSALDPINPSVDIAYERFIKEKRSIQVGFGYILPTDRNNNGFKIRTEYRFYKKESKGLYLAPELLFLHNNYSTSGEFGKQNDTTGYNYYEDFKVDKNVFAISGKIGYQFKEKRLCADVYTGIGIRLRHVVQYERENPEDDFISPVDVNAYYMADSVYPVAINFSINIKVGFSF